MLATIRRWLPRSLRYRLAVLWVQGLQSTATDQLRAKPQTAPESSRRQLRCPWRTQWYTGCSISKVKSPVTQLQPCILPFSEWHLNHLRKKHLIRNRCVSVNMACKAKPFHGYNFLTVRKSLKEEKYPPVILSCSNIFCVNFVDIIPCNIDDTPTQPCTVCTKACSCFGTH